MRRAERDHYSWQNVFLHSFLENKVDLNKHMKRKGNERRQKRIHERPDGMKCEVFNSVFSSEMNTQATMRSGYRGLLSCINLKDGEDDNRKV